MLRERMSLAGYIKFGLKKRKGSIIGCFYMEHGKKKNVDYIDIGINWSTIKQTLVENAKKKKEGASLTINDVQKHFLQPIEELIHPTPTKIKPKTAEIDYNKQEIAVKKENAKLRAKTERIRYEARRVIRKNVVKATTYIKKRIQYITERIQQFRTGIYRCKEDITREKNAHENIEYEINTTQKRNNRIRKSIKTTTRLNPPSVNSNQHEYAPDVLGLENLYSFDEIYHDITLILRDIEKTNQEIIKPGISASPTQKIKPKNAYALYELVELWETLTEEDSFLLMNLKNNLFQKNKIPSLTPENNQKNKKNNNFNPKM